MAAGLVTEAEFLALPESHDRIELIDGEILLSPSPSPIHQMIVARLCRIVGAWADAHSPAFMGLSPLDVRLGSDRIVQPDLFVLLAGLTKTEGPIDAVPDLVIEVLSSNRGYDRLTKRVLYAQAGVREYWVVDPLRRCVEVIEGLERAETFTSRATSRVCADLTMDVQSLLPS